MSMLRKRQQQTNQSFNWIFCNERPVFLIPLEGELQWLDSEGFHVGDEGVNKGVVLPSPHSKEKLAEIMSELTTEPVEATLPFINQMVDQVEEYDYNNVVFFTYDSDGPVLDEPAEEAEEEVAISAPVEEVATQPEVKETKKPRKKRKNTYENVSRPTLLHHARKHQIKLARGLNEEEMIEVLKLADEENWDAVKSHPNVTAFRGENKLKVNPEVVKKAIASPTIDTVIEAVEEEVAVEPVIQEPETPTIEEVEVVAEGGPYVEIHDLVEKCKGYSWNFSLEELKDSLNEADYRVVSIIYGASDNEEIGRRLEKGLNLSALQTSKLLYGFEFGAKDYPSLVEMLLESRVIS